MKILLNTAACAARRASQRTSQRAMRARRAGTLGAVAFLVALAFAPTAAAQSDREPTLPIAWNRFYDYDGIVAISEQLASTFPERCRIEYIGESVEGRPMPLLTISNPATGEESSKPAMWVDGNVHGNEVQGSEAALYLAWTLLERHDELPRLATLLDETVFYILPMVNPDGRDYWFHAPNTMHSSRSGKRPTDNDGDGRFDEDGPDDLDGDGELLSMRQRVAPGTGTHKLRDGDPRVMDRVPAEDRVKLGADWVMLGQEGIDNDGDGRVNEDGPGGYDMNRNWPSGWRPNHIQYGAGDYPFSFPETAAIGEFLMAHPNVAAVQSFHNSGGMILRGPGADARQDYYSAADRRSYDAIASEGEAILPHYRSLVIFEDLYDVHGGFVDWTAEGLGILSFTNELWASSQYFNGVDSAESGTAGRLQFDDHVMFGETYVDWHEVEHPDYGTVEVGGFRKMTGRTPPTFMIEEMLHRNAAFCIFHAEQMPKLELVELQVNDGPAGTHVITAEIRNTRWIPTRTAVSADKALGRPDLVLFESDGLNLIAAGPNASRTDATQFSWVEHEAERLRLDSGVSGHGTLRLRWIVSGSGSFTITYDAQQAASLEISGEV
ncbi:MAG: peptidase M14 [Planctomycetota bacterium]|nr:MAG: peptidase M14 [Planctomycetota bacterium]